MQYVLAPFKTSIQKLLDLGLEVFVIRGTFVNRREGLAFPWTLWAMASLGFQTQAS